MKKILSLFLAVVMFLSISAATYAADLSKVKSYSPKLPDSIHLGNGNYARLVNANLLPAENGNTLLTTIRFYNGNNTDLDMTNYWVRYKMKGSNQSFSTKIVPSDTGISKIPSKTQAYISFYSNISSDITLDKLQVQFIKWDFSVENFERSLGVVDIPNNTFTAPPGEKYNIQLNGINIDTLIEKVLITKNEQNYKTTVYYTIENKAKTSLKMPGLKYYVQTKEGILYELNSANTTDKQMINPHTSIDLVLRGNIPSKIAEGNWKLIVVMSAAESTVSLPVATYTLPKTTQSVGNDFNKDLPITDSNGLFNVKINSVNRLPLEDKDILSAVLTITNKDTETLPIPNLTGKYVLDGVIDLKADLIQPDKLLGIKPNESITAYFYALVPYTYDFTEVKLVLEEKSATDGSDNDTLVEVSGTNVITEVYQIAVGNEHLINNIGSTSSFKAITTRIYEGTTADIYSTQVDATNLEKRQANVTALAAYYKLSDGTIFPATVSKVEAKMSPGGKTLLDIYTTVSKSYSMEGAVLMLGEAVNESVGDDKNSTLVAYVNPIELLLPEEEESLTDLTKINFYPYDLSISNVTSSVNYADGKLTVGFDYIFNRNLLVQTNAKNKKIVIEIEDEANDILFTNEYDFEKGEGDSTNVFKIGEHTGTFVATDMEIIFKINTMKSGFTFKVYEQMDNGFKKLLASKDMIWFATNK